MNKYYTLNNWQANEMRLVKPMEVGIYVRFYWFP